MQPYLVLLGLLGLTAANSFYTITAHTPDHPHLDGKVIHARDRSFIIGAASSSTRCGVRNAQHCPAGDATLINENMSYLAAAVPGGQFIYVAPDDSISYPSAHSTLRPPGSQVGGFYSHQIPFVRNPPATVLSWQSKEGPAGLWACPVSAAVPVTHQAVLKAATVAFKAEGCLPVAGIRIQPAGSSFGAWEYT